MAANLLAITNATVIDAAGSPPLPDTTVVIEGERIRATGRISAPDGAVIVQGRGMYLIPGLWDMHAHLCWAKESALSALLANGVSGVRDMGGHLYEIDAWRARIEVGVLPGPRVVRAGPILNGRKANQYQVLTGGADEARGVVRALKQAGVDLIKVHRRVEREAYFAIADEAKRQELPLAGHIPMTITPEEASDAGQQIEHVETLFEGTFSDGLDDSDWPLAIEKFRAAGGAERLFERFARNSTVFDPVLIGYRSLIDAAEGSLAADPRSRYVAASFRQAGKAQPAADAAQLETQRRTFAQFIEIVRAARASGVTMIAGTDLAAARLPGFHLHDELALLAEAGLSPAEALRAATLDTGQGPQQALAWQPDRRGPGCGPSLARCRPSRGHQERQAYCRGGRSWPAVRPPCAEQASAGCGIPGRATVANAIRTSRSRPGRPDSARCTLPSVRALMPAWHRKSLSRPPKSSAGSRLTTAGPNGGRTATSWASLS